MATHRYLGRIVERSTQEGLSGLRVEATDVTRQVLDVVAAAITGDRGEFTLEVDDTDLKKLFEGTRAVLSFQVIDALAPTEDGTVAILASTERTHRWAPSDDGSGFIEVVRDQPIGTRPSSLDHYIVEGVVGTRRASTLGAILTVHLFERRIQADGTVGENRLGTATTAEDGAYRITYPVLDRRVRPDVLVRAYERETLVGTATVCAAPARATIDIVPGGEDGARHPGVPRYWDASSRVARALQRDTVGSILDLTDLKDESLDYVSCRAEIDRSEVEALVQAAQLHDVHRGVDREIFYGILSSGIAKDKVFTHRLSTLGEVLIEASQQGVIAPAVEDEIESILQRLEAAAVVELSIEGGPSTTLGELAARTPGLVGIPNVARRGAFIRHALRTEGDSDALWAAVAADGGNFDANAVASLKFTVDAADVVSLVPVIVERLHARRTAGQVRLGRDLAKYDQAQWEDVIASSFPADTVGDDDNHKRATFAKIVLKRVEQRYRTAFIGFRETAPDVLTFFNNAANVDFELGRFRVAHYVTQPNVMRGIDGAAAQAAVIDRLKTLERLYKVTTNHEQMAFLLDNGVHSGVQIHRLGQKGLAALSGASMLSSEALHAIFSSACWSTWAALAMYGKYSAKLEPVQTKRSIGSGVYASTILPNKALALRNVPGIPDWEELFGTLDQCSCEHCRSVLSPSAYLVDLLEYMERVKSGAATAKAALIDRRPDIAKLVLSCENGETAMPYVDLVNEILEVSIATHGAPPPDLPVVDTQRSTNELLGHPEIFYPEEYIGAYTKLAEGLHPFSMPFHLWAKEARVYLEHLGVPRHVLMRALSGASGPTDREVTIERLDLAPKQYDIVAGAPPAPAANALWGLEASSDYMAELTPVPVFLRRSGLTYDELRELLGTRYSQSARIALLKTVADDPCGIDNLKLVGLTTQWLEETNKLLRIRLSLGWTVSLAAKAKDALGADWEAVTKALGGLKVLGERTQRELLELLAWFSNIDTWPASPLPPATPSFSPVAGYLPAASLFERLFLNKAVLNPDEAALRTVHTTGSVVGPLKDRALGLLPALRLSQGEFALLTDTTTARDELALPPLVDGQANDPTTLSAISRIYRFVSAARASAMRLRDFRILHGLAGVPGLFGDAGAGDAFAMVEASLRLLDVADKVRATGAPLDEIHYVLRHVAPEASGLEPTGALLAQWQSELQAGLDAIIEDLDNVDDSEGDRLKALVDELLGTTAIAEDILLLAEEYPLGTSPALPFAARVALITQSDLTPYLRSTEDALEQLVGTEAPSVVEPTLRAASNRRTYLARELYRFVAIRGFVFTWAASTLQIPQDAASHFLEGVLTWTWTPEVGAPVTYPSMFAFARQPRDLEDAVPWVEPAPGIDGKDRSTILLRLHKAALLAKRFQWDGHDVRALFPSGADLPLVNPDALPTERPTEPSVSSADQALFTNWLRYSDLTRLRDAWSGGRDTFYAFFRRAAQTSPPSAPTEVDALDAVVASAYRWRTADVAALRGAFGVVSATGYATEVPLVHMADAMALITRLGATAAQALDWARPTYALPTSLETLGDDAYGEAADIKRVAKAKHGEAAWAEIARPLRNVLRERQRSTLVDCLILLKPSLSSPNDVYAHHLVDVEMSPCQLTSRLVLAHSSAQLFMHRMLLNLETFVPDEGAAREWQWMKNYRVWEANRKVFLWPENWIEPELRDDKSPLFKELETRLLQGTLDHDSAEEAYRAYLEGLTDVANLDIVAVHAEDADPEDPDIFDPARVLHVFGRSRSANKHFYRRRVDGKWSPWEKLDIDIDAQHLVATTLGGRLYLFWPQWNTRAAPVSGGRDPEATQKDQLGVRMAWSELRSTGWTAPAFGPNDYAWLHGQPKKASLAFTAQAGVEDIRIECIEPSFVGQKASVVVDLRFHPGTAEVHDPKAIMRLLTIPRPGWTTPDHQAFRLVPRGRPGQQGKRFRPYVPTSSESSVRGTVFAEPFNGFRFLSERRKEPYVARSPAFFTSETRTLLLEMKRRPWPPRATLAGSSSSKRAPVQYSYRYRAEVFYHPFVTEFRTALAVRGLDGLLRWADQTPKLQKRVIPIADDFHPSAFRVQYPFPKETVDFTITAPYSLYNWELFFHAPLLIATRLSQEGRHAEAQKWFHYVFDPTDGSPEPAPRRYWKFKPFYENDDLSTIQADLTALSLGQYVEEIAEWSQDQLAVRASDTLATQIATWRDDPFDPHAIARMRVVAYQKNVVMKYIDNLLSWGDRLFAQDTIESINEATQLYILAAELLGDRPTFVQPETAVEGKAYSQLGAIDKFSNAIVDIESTIPAPTGNGTYGCSRGIMPAEIIGGTTYFCVPPNEKLLGLWDTVADRLFKIRHCMNIEGIVRTLPLFEPPIDPAMLVAAVAAGVDIGAVVNDLNAAAPIYRYPILHAKAQEFTASVIGLASALLSALEKGDAEHLSNLRTQHEVAMSELIIETRRTQVDEAKQNLRTVEHSLKSAQERHAYYGAKKKIYPSEQAAMDFLLGAQISTVVAGTLNTTAAIFHALPDGVVGFPIAATKWGGSNVANALQAGAHVAEMISSQLSYQAGTLEKTESYTRRKEDWDHQAKLAELEIAQIDREILAAQIRLALAEKELANSRKQLEQSREIESFLRTKFTNEDLYGWMRGQLSVLYQQAYQLAYEMAKRAEKALQFERGDDGQRFIRYGQWDGLRRGLLAGEKLAHDLHRMDAAYLAQNKREIEVVKLVSLAEHNPDQLVSLRELGVADLALDEDDYDRDFPDHYLRRLKSVAVTVPCTVGPYQGVQGTLDLLQGATRLPNATIAAYRGPIQSICTSQAQSDSGLFELRFQDERLLPFEGVGAHRDPGTTSPQWRFSLSKGNRFKISTVDDLVLDIRYTARRGLSRPPVRRTLHRLVRVRSEFREAWHAFANGDTDAVAIALPASSWTHGGNEKIVDGNSIGVIGWRVFGWWSSLHPSQPPQSPAAHPTMAVTPPSGAAALETFTSVGSAFRWETPATPPDAPTPHYVFGTPGEVWTLSPQGSLRSTLKDLWVVFDYTVTVAAE